MYTVTILLAVNMFPESWRVLTHNTCKVLVKDSGSSIIC